MAAAQRDHVEAEAVVVHVAALEVARFFVAAVIVVVVPKASSKVLEKLVMQAHCNGQTAELLWSNVLLLVLLTYEDRPELQLSMASCLPC